MTTDTRQAEKTFLRTRYPDYDPRHHDAFVLRYRGEQERAQLHAYERARGIDTLPQLAHAIDTAAQAEQTTRTRERQEQTLCARLAPRKSQAEPVGLFAQTQGQLF